MVLACLPQPSETAAALLYSEDPAGAPADSEDDGEDGAGGPVTGAAVLVMGGGLASLGA